MPCPSNILNAFRLSISREMKGDSSFAWDGGEGAETSLRFIIFPGGRPPGRDVAEGFFSSVSNSRGEGKKKKERRRRGEKGTEFDNFRCLSL